MQTTVSAPSINFRGHVAELDAMRALGLCMVLICHFWPRAISELVFQVGQLGWMAMDSFFVMSGFLITGILLDSRGKPTYYSTYFARRSLRIFPLYYVVLLLWWCIGKFTDYGNGYRTLVHDWGSPMWFTFYMGNIRDAVVGKWPTIFGYAPLWSLQLEEQYYLLFPFAVAWMKRENLRRLLWAAVIISPICRVLTYLWNPHSLLLQFVLLPCHCEGLALGGLIAIRFRSGPWHLSTRTLALWTAVLLGFTAITSVVSIHYVADPFQSSAWDRVVGYSISSFGCAGLVLLLICVRGSAYTAWMRIAPLQYLGKISYGVYLLHEVALWIMTELIKKHILHFRKDDPVWFAEVVGLSLALAAISWHFFESPLLKLKSRFSYAGPARPQPADSANVRPSSNDLVQAG
jgi:peptidoglycan/LPS O-acetylase OafA/YrhL